MDPQPLYTARLDSLVVEAMGDELLVYDERTDVAHSLTPVAAAVFTACGTGSTLQQLCEVVAGVDPEADAEALVLKALADLSDRKLLVTGVSRRDALRKAAQAGAAAMAVPLIVSAAVPSPAAAASPGTVALYGECTADSDCKSGFTCNAGTLGFGSTTSTKKYCYTTGQTCYRSGTKPGPSSNDNCTSTTASKCCSGACSGSSCL